MPLKVTADNSYQKQIARNETERKNKNIAIAVAISAINLGIVF